MTRSALGSLLPTLALAVFSTFTAAAQTPAASTSPTAQQDPMPTDPAELMKLAAERNGLSGPGLKPWHIKATYQTYDDHGKAAEQGVFEEWWAAPKKYKVTFDRPGFHHALFVDGHNRTATGDLAIPLLDQLVQQELTTPVPVNLDLRGRKLERTAEKVGKLKLSCVQLVPPGLPPSDLEHALYPEYCFEPDKPILRIAGSFGQGSVTIERVAALGGRYLAEDITIINAGKLFARAHLVFGDMQNAFDNAIFIPSQTFSAEKIPSVEPAVFAGHRKGGYEPGYPTSAKIAGISGTVVLKVVIGADGDMDDVEVLSAPSTDLAASALAAIKTWRYQPYMIAGRPVEVQTTIHVVFNLQQQTNVMMR